MHDDARGERATEGMLTKQQDVRRCCSDGRIWNKLEEEEDEQCLSRENKTGIALRLVWFFF